jgi:hypothetical protein
MGGGEFDKRAKIFLSLSLSAPPAGFWERRKSRSFARKSHPKRSTQQMENHNSFGMKLCLVLVFT